jgi:serine/threonine protein phosphatase PrpC
LPEAQLEQTGCTAVAAVLTPRAVVCAWVGDSRCVVGTHGGGAAGTVALSFDHKPQHEKEDARIRDGGGHVFRGRVNGMLAVSRALGDYFYKANAALPPEKQLVSCVPDSRVHARDARDEFVILACDGVWDVCTNEQACAFVRAAYLEGVADPSLIAKRLIEYCLLMGSRDNMTAIVLLLNVDALRASGEREAAEREAAAAAWTTQAEAAAADPKAAVPPAPSSKEEIERLPISIPAALYAHKVTDRRASPSRSRGRRSLPLSFFRPHPRGCSQVMESTRDIMTAKSDEELKEYLKTVGLAKYAEPFLENTVDGECLMEVSETEFREDLMMKPEDARLLTKCIDYWKSVY